MTTILNIPLELIDTQAQVRTKFNDETITELAADIRAHGVLQPLVVQQHGERFTLLIGERRLRAIRYLGDMTAPAIVATVSNELAEEVQLMENIQREDLNTKDLSAAIKSLWKKHGTVAAVAARCNKSPSWVSKRLALALSVGTCTAALIDGNIKDVELIYNFGKLEKTNPIMARELMTDVLTGKAGRKAVNEALIGNDDHATLTALLTPTKDTNTGDLFAETQQSDRPAAPIGAAPAEIDPETDALRQQYATMYKTLEAIANMDKSMRPIQKAEAMRSLARDCLNGLV